jgi:branched-chain amino acid transport system permease protein
MSRPTLKRYGVLLAGIAVLLLLDWAITHILPPYPLRVLINMGIAVTLAISLNLVLGHTGQFSLGHAGFMAIGAYVSAFITVGFPDWVSQVFINETVTDTAVFVGATFLGALVAAVAGFVVGAPTLRLRGDYLAIATLGFGEIVRVVLLNIESVGAARGLSGIPHHATLFWVLGAIALCSWVIQALLDSTHGRAFLAVREDEVAAQAVGIDVTRYKVLAFIISSFFAGVAGSLFAHHEQYLNPQSFQFQKSIEIVVMVVVGGLGNTLGVAIAAALLSLMPEALRGLQELTGTDFRMVIYSLLLVVLMLVRPQGLFSSLRLAAWWQKRRPA